jgi:cytochrome c oxidase assembly factor 1
MPPPRITSALLRARPQSQLHRLRCPFSARHASSTPSDTPPTVPWKTPHSITAWPPENLIPPPRDGEILLERKPNRDLPPYATPRTRTHAPAASPTQT